MCNRLFMLPVRIPANSTLFVVKFQVSQKLYVDLQLCKGSVPLTPALCKGQRNHVQKARIGH